MAIANASFSFVLLTITTKSHNSTKRTSRKKEKNDNNRNKAIDHSQQATAKEPTNQPTALLYLLFPFTTSIASNIMKTRGMKTRSEATIGTANNAKAPTTAAKTIMPAANKFASPSVAVKPNVHIADATERLADAAAAASTSPKMMTAAAGRQVRFATSLVATPVLVSTRQNSVQVSSYQTTEALDDIIGQMQGMAIQDRQDEEQERSSINNCNKSTTTAADHHRATSTIAATLPTTTTSSNLAAQLSPRHHGPVGKRTCTPAVIRKNKSSTNNHEVPSPRPSGRVGWRLTSPTAAASTSPTFYETVVQSKKSGGAVTVKRSKRLR
jgi:hypothetical protein